MRTIAIVQARMSSRRFPGKVLHPIKGVPMIHYVLQRVSLAQKLDDVVVATSDRADDQAIAAFCHTNGFKCITGSLSDVAGRFVKTLRKYPAESFVRICADSPLIDPKLIDQGVAAYFSGPVDLVTNVSPRTFPCGQSIEVVRTSVFLDIYDKMTDPDDREHVTRYYYRHRALFKISNFVCDSDLSRVRLAVDRRDDMIVFSNIVKRMDSPHWTYDLNDILDLYEAAGVNAGGGRWTN